MGDANASLHFLIVESRILWHESYDGYIVSGSFEFFFKESGLFKHISMVEIVKKIFTHGPEWNNPVECDSRLH